MADYGQPIYSTRAGCETAHVVLVVAMIRGFMEPGHNLYCGDAAREIIPNVRELIAREQDTSIVHLPI